MAWTGRSSFVRKLRVGLFAFAFFACGLVAVAANGAGGADLSVSAAASLTAALTEIATTFEKTHADTDVKTNFAGSPTLVRQILEGAPVDVFASADEANMQKLVDAGKVAGSPKVFAQNRLEIIVEKGNPKKITSLADLAQPRLVVALCAPTVPAGRYAREAFAKAGVAVPKASEELDVKAVVTKVALGEVDAGIVYATDVRAAGDAAEGVAIPETSNVVARCPIAVLKNAPNRASADAFVALATGSEGRAILEKLGFLAP